MADEYPVSWENVSTDDNYETKRLRVTGGWVVMVRDYYNDTATSSFVPDPQHTWVLEESALSADTTPPSTTISTDLTFNQRLATSRKPRYYNDTTGGTVITVPATSAKPAAVYIDTTLYVNTAAEQCDLSNSGRGGLDTGAVAANTPYYLYAIPATSGTTFDLVASASDPDTGPTGFSSWSYIGACATDRGSAVFSVFHAANGVFRGDTALSINSHTGDTTYTSKTLSGMPVTATSTYILIQNDGPTTNKVASVASVSSPSYVGLITSRITVAGQDIYEQGEIAVLTPQTLWVRVSDSANEITIYLLGWREDPMAYK